jgi:hypothetical protein
MGLRHGASEAHHGPQWERRAHLRVASQPRPLRGRVREGAPPPRPQEPEAPAAATAVCVHTTVWLPTPEAALLRRVCMHTDAGSRVQEWSQEVWHGR